MRKLFSKPNLLVLLFILAVGTFFRTFEIIARFHFDHDHDLYSWIFKDIVVNHHARLIGQLTSAPGIFIGSLFYYLITPFMLLTKMDPVGAIIPITTLGILTILSYYIVLSKLFNNKVGLIGSFLYAILLNNIFFDRRVVPSTPTNIWTIWYFYTVVMIARGNYRVLPILGILIGLIWHIHIALIPALIAIPAAVIVSRRLPSLKQTVIFLMVTFVSNLPLIVFETRHNFQQTFALVHNFTTPQEVIKGWYKFELVYQMISKNIATLLLSPHSLPISISIILPPILLITGLVLVKRKILTTKEITTFYLWILGVFLFFSFSSSIISEYYFYNIEVIFITIISLTILLIFKSSPLGKIIVFSLLALLLIKNIYFFTTQYIYHKGYLERKAVADFITKDANIKGYPCVGISYITSPGENVGFRYFFYLNNLKLIHPSTEVPVYNIVIPDELSLGEINQKYGHIGVILPKNEVNKKDLEKACQEPNTNLTDPMFGFTE